MNPNPVLLATELHKTYKLPKTSLHILRGVSLSVHAGEHVAITGKSGSGKSTLLHLLGGLDKPDAGHGSQVAVLGRALTSMKDAECARIRAKDIGFVFQSYHLLPEMDIVENVVLPAMALGHPNRSTRERAVHLLEIAGLGDRLGHLPKELSGGEQQRVAIARAMMNSPSVILADEPTGNLDPTTGRQILDMLFGIAKQNGENGSLPPALVIVTHSDDIAARCDRRIHLQNGTLSQQPDQTAVNTSDVKLV